MAGESYAIPPKIVLLREFFGISSTIRLAGGDRLPAERVLCEEIGVSRTALRAGITRLISCGTLESRRGSGTYVCPPKPLNIFQETYGTIRRLWRGSAQSRPRAWFGSKVVYADIDLAQKAQIDLGMPLFCIRRVRVVNGSRHRSRRLTSICPCAPRFPITILSRKASTTFCSRRGMSM